MGRTPDAQSSSPGTCPAQQSTAEEAAAAAAATQQQDPPPGPAWHHLILSRFPNENPHPDRRGRRIRPPRGRRPAESNRCPPRQSTEPVGRPSSSPPAASFVPVPPPPSAATASSTGSGCAPTSRRGRALAAPAGRYAQDELGGRGGWPPRANSPNGVICRAHLMRGCNPPGGRTVLPFVQRWGGATCAPAEGRSGRLDDRDGQQFRNGERLHRTSRERC